MSEPNKNKAGFQKDVSSVFKGVPVPQKNSARKTPGAPAPGYTPDVAPNPRPTDRLSAQNSLVSKLSRFEETPFIEVSNDGLWQQIKDKLFAPKPGVNPARQKAMVIMVPILAIIMIFAFRQVLSKAPHKTKGGEIDDTPVVSNAGSGNEIDWKIPEPIKVITRDPIKLPDESNTHNPNQGTEQNGTDNPQNPEAIIIKDIVYSKDKPSAVIGSRIVYVGDTVNGTTIIKINRDSIQFEKDGKKWEQNVRDGKITPIKDSAGQNEDPPESVK